MTVAWTKSALADVEALRAHIGRDSEHYAARFVDRILEIVDCSADFPELGPVLPDFEDRVVRERIFQNYRIFYEVQASRLVILAIVHAARDMGLFILEP
jgi:toxin ParE1/3/4